jgi:hypothetical protein
MYTCVLRSVIISYRKETAPFPSRHANKRGLRNSLGCRQKERHGRMRFCIYDGGDARGWLAGIGLCYFGEFKHKLAWL